MNSEEINVGDFVEVVNEGRNYDYYKDWATKYQLKSFLKGNPAHVGTKCKVVVKAPHGIYRDTLLGIEDTSGKQFIIGIEGVKKIETYKSALPEKFKFKTNLDAEYDAVLSECKAKYMVTWTNSSFHVPYPVVEVSKFIKRGDWTILEEANGVDGSGKPFNFTKELLKPFMRVKTQNGQMWIVAPNQHKLDFDCDFALCTNEEWTEFFTDAGDASYAGTNDGYEAVEVYDMPEYNIDMLVYGAVGPLLWKAYTTGGEFPKEIPNVENNVPEASGNFEQRLKHIEETLAGVNAKIAELQFLI